MHASPFHQHKQHMLKTLPCCAYVHVSVHSQTNGMCAMEFTMLTPCCGQERLQGSRPGRLAQCQRLAGQAQTLPSLHAHTSSRTARYLEIRLQLSSAIYTVCVLHSSPAKSQLACNTAIYTPHSSSGATHQHCTSNLRQQHLF